MADELTFIITPTLARAVDAAHYRGLRSSDWRFVTCPADVFGHRPPFKVVIEIGIDGRLTSDQFEAYEYLRTVERLAR